MSWSVRKFQTSNAAQVSGSNDIPLGRVVRAVPRGVGPDGKPKWVMMDEKVRKLPINLNGQTIWVDCVEPLPYIIRRWIEADYVEQPSGDQNKRKMVVQAGNPSPLQELNDDECTICYEPRNPAYMFYPCGHATFCKNCASRLFEESEKKCPDCRRPIKDIVRVFQ